MNRHVHPATGAPALLGALVLLGAALVAWPRPAAADCDDPDSVFCAEISVGAQAHGRVVVRNPRPNPPRVVVVEPAPPPPPPPPAPRVVVVEPQPPPPPPREVVVVQHTTRVVPAPPVRPDHYPVGRMGFRAFFGGSVTPDAPMGGFGGALRFRPVPHIGLDLGLAGWGGEDTQGRLRAELPVTLDMLVYFNPRSRFQVYGLVGTGVTFARVEELDLLERDFVHLGGTAGLGMEWFVARRFSLNLDFRAFLRHRVGGSDEQPEFVDLDDGQTTDTSAGAVITAGMAWYWGR